METVADRLADVQRRIAAACARRGRSADAVTVVAVAKTFGPEAVAEAVNAGIRIVGENRVQEARAKIPLCPSSVSWHMVGHLQRNKAREAVRLFEMIHSVDSVRLLDAIEDACEEEGKRMPVCLEVNVSGERSKFGLPPEQAPEALARAATLRRVQVVGLLTVPPFTPDPEGARPYLARLRELRDAWEAQWRVGLRELSMGMSHDFEVAVEEGATMVRLGTALLGPRQRAAFRGGATDGEV